MFDFIHISKVSQKKCYMPKTRELTIKQRKFVKAYVKSGNGTQSALEAYDTEDYFTGGSIAQENLKKPAIKKAIETALIELDITPKSVLKTFLNVTQMDLNDNPNAVVRANENLANILNLYPSQKSLSLQDGNVKSISWQE